MKFDGGRSLPYTRRRLENSTTRSVWWCVMMVTVNKTMEWRTEHSSLVHMVRYSPVWNVGWGEKAKLQLKIVIWIKIMIEGWIKNKNDRCRVLLSTQRMFLRISLDLVTAKMRTRRVSDRKPHPDPSTKNLTCLNSSTKSHIFSKSLTEYTL